MKKALLTVVGVLLMSGWAFAQVIADFESTTNGFGKGWGDSFVSIAKVADPSAKTAGVLGVEMDLSIAGNKQAALSKNKVDATTAHVITYWVYLKTGTPDSLAFKVFAQAPVNWDWQDVIYYAKDIPKEKWYPLNFDLDAKGATSANFDKTKGALEAVGIEIGGGKAGTTWKGSVYVDNVSLVGVQPVVVADFETTTGGFGKGWGDSFVSIAKATDPSAKTAGVLAVEMDLTLAGNKQAAISKNKVDGSTARMLTYYVYLAKDTPDSLAFKVFAQAPVNWDWQDVIFWAKNIPKEKWFPLNFDLDAKGVTSANFDKTKGALEAVGIEIGGAKAGTTWKGKIYVDNVQANGLAVGSKWVVSNFEAAAAGTQGFGKWWSTPPFVALAQASVDGRGVLKLSGDFSKATAAGDMKLAISKGNVAITSSDPVDTATAITIDVFVPADIPVDGTGQVGLIVNGAGSSWNESVWKVVDTVKATGEIVKGKWQTITSDVTALLAAGSITDAKIPVTVGVQVYYPNAGTFKGDFLFDNLTVVGLPEPKGTVAAPKATGKAVTYTLTSGAVYDYVQIDWIDNTLGTETYNLYQSLSPITDLKAEGVQKIVADIPHGMQSYITRPYSSDGAIKDYYYALTSFDGTNETALASESKVGPISVKTTKTYKIQYVKDFASKFVLDGLDAEFDTYRVNEIKPEAGSYASGPDFNNGKTWDALSADMNFKTTLVIDDKFLYISAVVDDDDLRQDAAQQAWEGDALEFYMGFYDAKILKAYHAKNLDSKNGDYRIGFNALGQTTRDGGAASTTDGVESTVFQKFTGDGYVIEAKIDLNKLAADGKFLLNNGMWMPIRIDGNDWDPNIGDTQRSLIVQVGGKPNDGTGKTDEGWKRPDDWGYMEVVGAPTTDVEESNLPTEFALSNNYPNPFNPTTTIKYDLPKESQVTLKIYDILGREVATLVNSKQNAGFYQIRFDASKYASGVYVYRIIAGDFVQTKKMMLMK
ncbi:MAG: T9SS type A sorting domain-containing protein [Melioribacteraceae bacterium]